MRKTCLVLVILASLLAPLWASAQKEAAAQPVTLRFASNRLLAQPSGPITKELLDKFAADKKITIEWEEQPGNDLQTKIKLDAMADRLPDIWAYWRLDPVFGLPDLASSGKLADLTAWVNSDAELKGRYDNSAWRTATLNDKIYGIPFNMFYVVVYVNKANLEKAGVAQIPETWEQWVAAVNTVKKAGMLPWGSSLKGDSHGGRLYNYIVNRTIGNEKAKLVHAGKEPYDTPEMRKAAQHMKELVIGFTPPDANALDNEAVFAKYVNTGLATFFIDGSWMVGRIVPDVSKNMVPVPFPLIPGGFEKEKRVEKDLTNLYYVAAKGWADKAKQPLIKDLLKELAGKELSQKFQAIGQPAAYRNLEMDPAKTTPLAIAAKKVADAYEGNKWIVSFMTPDQRTGFEPLMTSYLDGKVPIDQFLPQMDKVFRK